MTTNVSFLRALLSDPDFLAGELTTAFLDGHPNLMSAQPGATLGAASGLLLRLSEATVNRPAALATRLRALGQVAVTAGTSGTVDTVDVQDKAQVEPGDLVVAMTPAPPA